MSKTSVLLGAVGDIAFTGQIGHEMLTHGYAWPFAKVQPYLDRAELLFGNFEAAMVPPNFPQNKVDPKGLIGKIPTVEVAKVLKEAGFDFLNLAANHVFDTGTLGMKHTQHSLNQAGIMTGGIGRTQKEARRLTVVEKKGLSFGFLCYAEDSNCNMGHETNHAFYRLENVLADVERHKREVDILVVSIHADLEFMPTPSLPRLNASREIARAGAKIILEHHPHVPQGIEFKHGAMIAYSLGNFIFESHTFKYMKDNGPHTASSFVLLADVTKAGVQNFERVPLRIEEPPEQRPIPLTGFAKRKMLTYFKQLDCALQDEDLIRKTWREIAKNHLRAYIHRAAALEKEHGIDDVIRDIVVRLSLVDENRHWMNEILEMAKEHWDVQKKQPTPHHRPHTAAVQLLEKCRQKTGPKKK